jgi:S1-C subfamily serine protease
MERHTLLTFGETMIRILLAAFVLTIFTPVLEANTPPEWCVRIYVNKRGSALTPESMGSGTLISPTLIVTNHHVVEGRKSDLSIKVLFGSDWTTVHGRVVAESKVWDLAIIEIPETEKTPCTLGVDPPSNREGTIYGYGFGPFLYQTGKIGGFIDHPTKGVDEGEFKDDIRILMNASARPGDSGGAVICNGRLCGITSMSNGRHTLFIAQSQLRILLRDNNLTDNSGSATLRRGNDKVLTTK